MKLRFIFGYNMFMKFYLMSFRKGYKNSKAWDNILTTQYDSVQEVYSPAMLESEAHRYLKTIKQL